MLYDIEDLLSEVDLSDKEKEEIIKNIKDEFPQDEMLFELHLFRVIQFLKKQKISNSLKPI